MPLSPLTPKASRVLFIDEQYLKDVTPLNANVDPKIIVPAIKLAQDKHILLICGSGIFEELKTQITNNTLTTDNTRLLQEYIQPCLAQWATAELLPSLVYRLENKGIETKNSENSESAGIEDITYLVEQYESNAKYYSRMLISYLQRNNELYPLYYNPGGSYGSQVDTFYGIQSEYFSGLVIPQKEIQSNNQSIIGLGLGMDVTFVPKG